MVTTLLLALTIHTHTFAPVGGPEFVATLDLPRGAVAYSNFTVRENDLDALSFALDATVEVREGERPSLRISKAQKKQLEQAELQFNQAAISQVLSRLERRHNQTQSAEVELQSSISTIQQLPSDFSESSRAAVRSLLPLNALSSRLLSYCSAAALAKLPLGEPKVLVSTLPSLQNQGILKPDPAHTERLRQMRNWLQTHPLDDSHLGPFHKYALTLLYRCSKWSNGNVGYCAFVKRDVSSLSVNVFLLDEADRVLDGGSCVEQFASPTIESAPDIPQWITGTKDSPIQLGTSGRLLQEIRDDLPVASALLAQAKVAPACLPQGLTLSQALLSDCVKSDDGTKIICVLPGELIGAISKEVNSFAVPRNAFWSLLNTYATITQSGDITVIKPKQVLPSNSLWSSVKDEQRFWNSLRSARGRIGLQGLGDFLAAIGPGGFQSAIVDWARRTWISQAGGTGYGIEKEAALALSDRQPGSLGTRRLLSMMGSLTQDIRFESPRSLAVFWPLIESGRFQLAFASKQDDCFAVDPTGPPALNTLAPNIFGRKNFQEIPFDYWPETMRVFSGTYEELGFTATLEPGATLHFTMDDSPIWGVKSSPWKEVIKP